MADSACTNTPHSGRATLYAQCDTSPVTALTKAQRNALGAEIKLALSASCPEVLVSSRNRLGTVAYSAFFPVSRASIPLRPAVSLPHPRLTATSSSSRRAMRRYAPPHEKCQWANNADSHALPSLQLSSSLAFCINAAHQISTSDCDLKLTPFV